MRRSSARCCRASGSTSPASATAIRRSQPDPGRAGLAHGEGIPRLAGRHGRHGGLCFVAAIGGPKGASRLAVHAYLTEMGIEPMSARAPEGLDRRHGDAWEWPPGPGNGGRRHRRVARDPVHRQHERDRRPRHPARRRRPRDAGGDHRRRGRHRGRGGHRGRRDGPAQLRVGSCATRRGRRRCDPRRRSRDDRRRRACQTDRGTRAVPSRSADPWGCELDAAHETQDERALEPVTKGGARVSIGLPVFNGMPYLPEALASLLSQDEPDIEIIISDNASDDGTEEYCRSIAASDARVHYSRNEANRGRSGELPARLVAEHGAVLRMGRARRHVLAGLRLQLLASLGATP